MHTAIFANMHTACGRWQHDAMYACLRLPCASVSTGLTAAHRAILHVICTRAWMHVQVNLLVWVCVQRVSNGLWLCAVCWPFCLFWAVLCVVLRSCVLDAACRHVKPVKILAWALEQRARACMTCIPACCRKRLVLAACCLPVVVVSCFKNSAVSSVWCKRLMREWT